MVGAHKGLARVATLVAAQLNASVWATVVQNMDRLVLVSHHHHGLASNLHREIVAHILDLRLMAAVNPGLLKNVFHLEVK